MLQKEMNTNKSNSSNNKSSSNNNNDFQKSSMSKKESKILRRKQQRVCDWIVGIDNDDDSYDYDVPSGSRDSEDSHGNYGYADVIPQLSLGLGKCCIV